VLVLTFTFFRDLLARLSQPKFRNKGWSVWFSYCVACWRR